MTTEELAAALGKAQADNTALASRIAALEKQTSAEEEEEETEGEQRRPRKSGGGESERDVEHETSKGEIDKSELSAPVRAAVEKLEAGARKLQKRAEEAENIAKAERDKRLLSEAVTKAESLGHAVGDAQEAGPILKALQESLPPEQYEWVEKRFATNENQIARSELFKEYGSGVGGAKLPSDSFDNALAKA